MADYTECNKDFKANGEEVKIEKNIDDKKMRKNVDNRKIKEIGYDKKMEDNANYEKIIENGDNEKIEERGDDEKINENGDEIISKKGDDEKVKENGDDEIISKQGDDEKVKGNGDNEIISKKGDDEKVKENGDDEIISKKGDDDKVKENDDDEKIEEWSDRMCIEISMEDNFPANVENLTIQKSIINRFINFYLSGKVQKGLSARDIIFAVIAIMPYSLDSEEFIWRKDEYSEDGNLFFLTPEDRLKTEILHIIAKHNQNSFRNESEQHDKNNDRNGVPETSNSDLTTDELNPETNVDTSLATSGETDQENDATEKTDSTPNNSDEPTKSNTDNEPPTSNNDIIWYRTKPFNRASSETDKFEPVDNSAFCISCNKLLDNWDADVVARIHLKYFFGVVALSLMRTIAKSYQHVLKMFTSTFPKTIAGFNTRIHYSPPSPSCVKKTFKMLRKEECKTRIMFAKLVINSFYLNSKYSDLFKRDNIPSTGGIKNILNITVMAPTADYGMDIISMLQEVASRSQWLKFRAIFELFLTEETAASWNKVHDFLNKYMRKSGYQPTCHWARIIDKEQFKYLSCVNSYELAVVIAVFIEKLSDNDTVWSAQWVKSGKNLVTYKQLGLKMYEDYKIRTESDFFSSFKDLFTKLNVQIDL